MAKKGDYNPYTRMPSISPGSYGMGRKEKRVWGTAIAAAGTYLAWRFMSNQPRSSYVPASQRNALSDLTVSQADMHGITSKALETRPGVKKTVTISKNRTLLNLRFKDTSNPKSLRLYYGVNYNDGTSHDPWVNSPGQIRTKEIEAGVEETNFEFTVDFFDALETGKTVSSIYWHLETSGGDAPGFTYLFDWVVEG